MRFPNFKTFLVDWTGFLKEDFRALSRSGIYKFSEFENRKLEKKEAAGLPNIKIFW